MSDINLYKSRNKSDKAGLSSYNDTNIILQQNNNKSEDINNIVSLSNISSMVSMDSFKDNPKK